MIIYKITNTNKSYIGCTRHSLSRRWSQHVSASKKSKSHFHRAIQKYGVDCWDFKIIYTANDIDDLLYNERIFIESHDTFKNGYNSSIGGDQRSVMLGENNPMYGIKRNLRGENNPMYGKEHSDHAKRLIGDVHRGHSRSWGNHNDETKSVLRETQRGNMKKCVIEYNDGRIVNYPSLRALSIGEGICYQRVKQVAKSKSGYSRKHKCKIIV